MLQNPHISIFMTGVAVMLLAGCHSLRTSTVKLDCNFKAYAAQESPHDAMTLVPMIAGSMASLPLNAVRVIDNTIGQKILPTATGAERLATMALRVSARVQNCTNDTVIVEARTTFFDALNLETEKTTAWKKLYLPSLGSGQYETSSLGASAESYIIELRSGS